MCIFNFLIYCKCTAVFNFLTDSTKEFEFNWIRIKMFSIVLRFLSELGRFQIKIARRSDAVKLNSDFILIFIKFETGYRLPEIYVTVTFFSFPIIILFHCHLIKWLCHIEKGQMIGCEDESSADWIAAMSG